MSADIELVDEPNGLIARRVVVGALETNCWILFSPNSKKAIVIDPGDEPGRIVDACSDLEPAVLLLTHQHWDHVLGVPEVVDAFGLEVQAHPADAPIWPNELDHLAEHGHFDAGTATSELLGCGCHIGAPADSLLWDGKTTPLLSGASVVVGNLELKVLHTPGHTPGGLSFTTRGHVFTGDTLFPGGPGLTGWPFSDFQTIISSIRSQLFSLPGTDQVHPGHGESTKIAAGQEELEAWIARGW